VVLLHGCLEVVALAIDPMPVLLSAISLHLKGVTSGLKVVFFFPLLLWEDLIEVIGLISLSLKRWAKVEKETFWPMGEGPGKRFGVVFSFAVVVTEMELFLVASECTHLCHRKGKV
jgi:hypothetical protein